jgi:hypothetical protein
MDDEEIFEIIDEKKEIIADLEKEMSEIERTLGSELEDVWIVELQELVLKRERSIDLVLRRKASADQGCGTPL